MRGRDPLMRTAKEVGAEVRQMMIRNSGTAPEALPVSHEIAKVRRKLVSADREMKKLDGGKKKTRKPKGTE
jgi:DNA-damage-inducible protein D